MPQKFLDSKKNSRNAQFYQLFINWYLNRVSVTSVIFIVIFPSSRFNGSLVVTFFWGLKHWPHTCVVMGYNFKAVDGIKCQMSQGRKQKRVHPYLEKERKKVLVFQLTFKRNPKYFVDIYVRDISHPLKIQCAYKCKYVVIDNFI